MRSELSHFKVSGLIYEYNTPWFSQFSLTSGAIYKGFPCCMLVVLPSEICEAVVLIWKETEEHLEQVVWSSVMSVNAKYLTLR
jgi:hypothetical protein